MKRLLFLASLLLLPGLAHAKIFLVDTDDTVRVVTASGVSTIHMYAAWADLTTTALTPGNSDAQVTTATTTVLVAAPGASTQRQLKGLTIRNAHASSSNVITVEFFDGATATQLIQYTLLAGETLQWGEDENFRVIDASGQMKGSVVANAGTNLNTSALLTTSAHDAAFGTAGSADSQVRSVQGVASMTPLLVNPGTATNFGVYAEDSVHASGDNLVLAGVVRSDAASPLAADGDRTVLQVDANGYLKVVNINPNLAADNSTLSTSKVPVLPGTVSTSAPTWTNGNQSALSLQTDGSVRSAVTNTVTVSDGAGAMNVICDSGCSGGTQYNQGTAGTSTDALTMAGAVRKDTAAADAGAIDGDRIVLSTDSVGRLRVTSADTTQPVSGTITANAGSGTFTVSGTTFDGILKDGTGDTTQANVSGGRVHVDGSGVTQPVSGTITANAGTGTFFDGIIKDGTGDTTQANVSSGNLHVNCTNCSGSGAAHNDNAAFTGGTDDVAPMGALYDTTPPAITDGNLGAPRMNSSRILMVDGSGSTQPVSGTVTVTATNLDVQIGGSDSLTIGTFPDNEPFNVSQVNGSTVQIASNSLNTTGAGLLANAIVGQCDDTSPTALTENQFGHARINCTTHFQVMDLGSINGVTPLMGAGNTGTGSPRVTIATDQAALAGLGVYVEDAAETAGGNLSMSGSVRRDTAASSAGASGDNATLNTDANGLLWARMADPCSALAKTYLPININSVATTEITPSLAGASNHYYVCSINIGPVAGAQNLALVDDDTDNCTSVTSGLAGGTTAATGWNIAANGGLTMGNGLGSIARTGGTNRVLCLVSSAAVQTSGVMTVVAAP